MRALAIVIAVSMAACDPPGLTLEVVADDPAIDSVQLFVGEHCDGCPDMMSPPMLTAREANILVTTDAAVWSAATEGGVAGFRIAVDEDRHLRTVIAVGFAGDTPVATATLYDVAVSAHEPEYGRVHLVPAQPLDDAPGPQPDGTLRMALWRHPDQSLPSCVMVERWKGGTASRDAIVPADDRDCDRVEMARECAPYAANAMGSLPTVESAACFTRALASPDRFVCMLGGPLCDETTTTVDTTCRQLDTDYCLPNSVCDCIGSDALTCARTKIVDGTAAQTMPMIKCVFPTKGDGTPCDGAAPVPLDASVYLSAYGSSTKCTAIRAHPLELPFDPFATSVAIGSSTLKLGGFEPSCQTAVEWSGMFLSPAGNHRELLLADLALDNDKHLLVPMIVELLPERCEIDSYCSALVANSQDTLFDCIEPTPTMSSCAPEGICEGPVCGDGCCKAGEHCDNGVCRCGVYPACGDGAFCDGGPPGGCGACCNPIGQLPTC